MAREMSIYGLQTGTDAESEVLWRVKAMELAEVEMILLEWLAKKPDNEQLQKAHKEFAFLHRQFVDFHEWMALAEHRRKQQRDRLNDKDREIKELKAEIERLQKELTE